MFERLTTSVLETARQRIAELFDAHAEWFYTLSDGNTQALRRDELDINIAQSRLILSCWTEKGTRSWRIRGWNWTGEKLELQASRRMGAERPVIELIPRASASAIAATVRAARQVRCHQLAQLASEFAAGSEDRAGVVEPGDATRTTRTLCTNSPATQTPSNRCDRLSGCKQAERRR